MAEQKELNLPDVKLSRTTLEKAQLAVRLLSQATSLGVVSEYLKSKGLAHSASSWDEMRDKRILPAIAKRKVTFEDLFLLLAESEEFGRNHTFLYQCAQTDVRRIFERNRISAVAEKCGQQQAFSGAILVDLPQKPTLVEIREEQSKEQQFWVFKVIEKREEREYLGEKFEGNRVRKEWEIHQVRAVNVARFHASGLLEIRIQSHTNSTLYDADVKAMWTLLKDYLPPVSFRPMSLSKSKQALWANRIAKNRRIRFSDSIMRNTVGTTISASTGAEEADLFDDSAASKSIDQFLHGGAYCDSSNIWWLPRDRVTDREVHMLLSGENNEFAITAACTRAEYEYVLNELRVFNR